MFVQKQPETEISSDRLLVNTSIVSDTEQRELNRVLYNDLIPAFLADCEMTQWNEKGSKRKSVQSVDPEDPSYHNKYGVDYKRRKRPFFVMGMTECVRSLDSGNLRLLLVNKIGKTFYLIDSLLILCAQKGIPVIPMKCSQSYLSSLATPDHATRSVRISCLGITREEPPSRSLLSSLIYLENYYNTTNHVVPPFSLPKTVMYYPGQEKKHRGHNVSRSCHTMKRYKSLYSTMNAGAWDQMGSLVPIEVEKEKVEKPRPVKISVEMPVTKTEVPVETQKEKEKVQPKEAKPKKASSLKSRLKGNILFRFK